jgi:3-methyladenine DNA glycosylase AlkD
MLSAAAARRDLHKLKDPKRAEALSRFFKTGPGEYGEGDIFLGIKLPDLRAVAKKYSTLPLTEVGKLIRSRAHEERTVALAILVKQFEKGTDKDRQAIFDFYLRSTARINNWDLVDISAPRIVGAYLLNKEKHLLDKLARSQSLWEKRIAIIATAYFISQEKFSDTLRIAKILLNDKHDLIHKAVGWMLREVGKRSLSTEEGFLQKHYQKMPRTMLRYAIERFPEKRRQDYLKGRV